MRFIFFIFLSLSLNFAFSQNNILSIWHNLNDTSLSLEALKFVINAKEKIKPPVDTIISIIDYTKPSTEKRFYIIDTKNQKILVKTFVAHGKYTGENIALHYSNRPHSGMSSPGLYMTGNTYFGKHGYSLKLHGLEKGINDNAFKRAIVIHGAWYVTEDLIKSQGRLGRSLGCPAVAENEADKVINFIKNGTLLFIFTNDKNYWERTKYKQN